MEDIYKVIEERRVLLLDQRSANVELSEEGRSIFVLLDKLLLKPLAYLSTGLRPKTVGGVKK